LHFASYQQLSRIPRYREVANVFIKHGFGFLFDRISPWKLKKGQPAEEELRSTSAARQLRGALEELGPTYIKIGQLLSTRPDLLAPEYIRELEKLQDNVLAVAYADIYQVCADEGILIDEVFADFVPEPLAAASIAQVHAATLKDGQKVVVKIQRPGIDRLIEKDLEIIKEIARLVERKTDWGRLYRITDIVEELGQAVLNEVDFRKEAHNADIFYHNFRENSHVVIPRVFWNYSSRRVLTLEYLEGTKVSDTIGLKKKGYDPQLIAANLVDALYHQVFEYGFFHADPHPGNLAIVDGEGIIFFDFGQVGVMDKATRDKAMDLLVGMMRYDVNAVTRALLDIGIGSQFIDQTEFRRDISRLQQKYYGLPLSQINIGEALAELIELSFKYQVRIPAELSLLVKMLMTVENMVSQLDPQLSIVDIAEPYGKRVLKQRLSIDHLKDRVGKILLDYTDLARTLPRDIDNVLKMLEAGEIRVKMEHHNLNRLANKVDILSNRLALAIILAAIIIGTSLVVGESGSHILSRFPLVEAGFVVGILLGLGLVYSIFKSGRY
jgi:ubiquinone biosynthesis protein